MVTPRSIRLDHDYEAMRVISGDIISWEAIDGRTPPEKYRIHYNLVGLASPDFFIDEHAVELRLLAEYPSRPPLAKFISRPLLYHPHVFENGVICIGGYSPDESLAALCLRIAKYIQFHPNLINTKSPANQFALKWFIENRARLPIDTTPLPELPE